MQHYSGRVDQRRVTTLASGTPGRGPVVYWMDRDRRVADNWALLYAQDIALGAHTPLVIVTSIDNREHVRTARRLDFLLSGLREVEAECRALGIAFVVAMEPTAGEIVRFARDSSACALVTDFTPLRDGRADRSRVAEHIEIPMYEVDAHNIVPARFASTKQEWAAYTFRPKVNRVLGTFLSDIPSLQPHPFGDTLHLSDNNWSSIAQRLAPDLSVPPVDWAVGGTAAGMRVLNQFASSRLAAYRDWRNDPTKIVQSDLSPWLNFGFVSAQRVALEIQRRDDQIKSQEAFFEELIVRRELAENFCLYNSAYDSIDGAPAWALESLALHQADPREYLYSEEELARGETHDALWNAAKWEMVCLGKMHGYLRMYWAKKILEWSPTPAEAYRRALYLNDRYELDGIDPNGYAGVAWSIAGVHDRPWFEREIFGKIRYMSYSGCRRKFDVDTYVETMQGMRDGVML